MKKCYTCGVVKDDSEFHLRNGKPRSNCKECHKTICKDYHYVKNSHLNQDIVDLDGEIWKLTEESPLYKVSNKGRIQSFIGNKVTLLTPHKVGGYLHIEISGKQKKVHRLVATAFIKNAENKPQVNHLDGDKVQQQRLES